MDKRQSDKRVRAALMAQSTMELVGRVKNKIYCDFKDGEITAKQFIYMYPAASHFLKMA